MNDFHQPSKCVFLAATYLVAMRYWIKERCCRQSVLNALGGKKESGPCPPQVGTYPGAPFRGLFSALQ
jgi:hypothetical protein